MANQRPQTLTVSQATQAIKQLLEANFRQISIQGEISNLKAHSSGHFYFSLKDPQAQISAVLFSREAKALSRLPQNGDKVTVQADLTVYEPHGAYKLIVRSLQYAGLGDLLLQLEALKRKLMALGWFDRGQKKPLPKSPKCIGVITSPTGAVIQDIIHVLTRRVGNFSLLLNPVKVQGEGAAQEIAQAIEEMNRYQLADVLIVGRGGGSLEDLWAFNEEIVAKAIHESQIPIISAVGHETDFSIADMVADVRAPTPSAAAEMVMAETAHQVQLILQAERRLFHFLTMLLKNRHERLKGILRANFLQNPRSYFEQKALALDDLSTRLQDKIELALKEKQRSIQELSKRLELVDPKKLLKRGYAMVFSKKNRSIILSSTQLTLKESLLIQFSEGKVAATVEEL